MYDHDLIVSKLKERTLNSKSWKENKQYSQMPIPKNITDYILTL